jgi:general secretion pathway protein N
MNVRAARLATKGLAGVCGVLLLLLIAQYAGFGRGYRWAADVDGEAGKPTFGPIDSKPVSLPPASTFADIGAHPLFNEDRKPSPLDASEGEAGGPPPSPLNIALTGVILDDAHHVRIAMLQDKARNQAIALKVGMPLEGEQASWTLIEVKPRGAVFRSAANETSEVELETAVAAAAPPRAGAHPASAATGKPPAAAPASDKGQDSSADLARRIEERRKQMREDAERLRSGGNDKPAPPKK